MNILSITGPIYLSIALGFVATRRGMFSKVDGQVLGRFLLNFALPAMLFNTLSQRDFAEVMNPHYLVAYGVGPMTSSLKITGVLLASMPMLGIYPLLAQRHGQEGFCAAALLVTTVASFFTISLILWAMGELPGWHV
ncbi:AEC family transporter [Limnohabitans sp.]|uniref:AEC family transporter n=1 Tax=Limnohabitans sp. TaxID=1907725 RepID=UPI00286F3197|nr:AEC family transporter [Limnohabitans sp.]